MIAAGLVANGAKVYIAARKEGQLKAVCFIVRREVKCLRDLVQAADELNAAGPGKCLYIVADLSVRKFASKRHTLRKPAESYILVKGRL